MKVVVHVYMYVPTPVHHSAQDVVCSCGMLENQKLLIVGAACALSHAKVPP